MKKYGTGTRRNGNFYKAKISEYTKTNSQSELCEFPKINEFSAQKTWGSTGLEFEKTGALGLIQFTGATALSGDQKRASDPLPKGILLSHSNPFFQKGKAPFRIGRGLIVSPSMDPLKDPLLPSTGLVPKTYKVKINECTKTNYHFPIR